MPHIVTTPSQSLQDYDIKNVQDYHRKSFQDAKIKLMAEEEPINKAFTIGFLIFLFIWVLIGFAAFITSLVCFGRKGTTIEKIIGLLLAIFFGPFYFIFFFFGGDYCGSLTK